MDQGPPPKKNDDQNTLESTSQMTFHEHKYGLFRNAYENPKNYLATPEHQTYVFFMGKNFPLLVGWFTFIQKTSC